jgi:class 3 adenylate cyclase
VSVTARAQVLVFRIGYVVAATASVLVLLASLPQWLALVTPDRVAREAVALGLPFSPLGGALVVAGLSATAFWLAVGVLLVWRRRDPFGLVLSLTALVTAVSIGPLSVPDEIRFAGSVGYALAFLANFLSVLGLYLFPNGRFTPTWTRYLGGAFFLWNCVGFWMATSRGPDPDLTLISLGSLIFFLSGPAAQIYRYSRVSGPIERQQTKWVTYGIGAVTLAWSVRILVPLVVGELRTSSTPAGLLFADATALTYDASVLLLGITLAVAMLRRNLLGIDLIINRTVAYSVVTGLLAVFFALVTVVAQRLAALVAFPSEPATIVAALAVAAAFVPVRNRVRDAIDRLLPPRALLALLFTDIVASTETATRLGDARWRQELERYRVEVRRPLRRFGGREVDTAGDGFFATFDKPALAVRCAIEIRERTSALGLASRTAVHWGECEVRGEKVSGINVHIAARLVSLAGPDEIVVSDATRSEVAADGIQVAERGTHTLKGVPGEWSVYALTP